MSCAGSSWSTSSSSSGRLSSVLRRAEGDQKGDLISNIASTLGVKKEQRVENADWETPVESLFNMLSGKKEAEPKGDDDFIDSSDEANYVTVTVEKPLGIGLAESSTEEGGVMISEVKPGSNADQTGQIQPGFQLVMAGNTPVHGMPLQKIVEIVGQEASPVRLTFFKGPAKFFYGTLGPSSAWLSDFLQKRKA